jgi:hypothetical protein
VGTVAGCAACVMELDESFYSDGRKQLSLSANRIPHPRAPGDYLPGVVGAHEQRERSPTADGAESRCAAAVFVDVVATP